MKPVLVHRCPVEQYLVVGALHQQALAWGVSKKLKVVQRSDNQVLPYWMTKQDE